MPPNLPPVLDWPSMEPTVVVAGDVHLTPEDPRGAAGAPEPPRAGRARGAAARGRDVPRPRAARPFAARDGEEALRVDGDRLRGGAAVAGGVRRGRARRGARAHRRPPPARRGAAA